MTNFDTEFDKYYAKAIDLLQETASTTDLYKYISTIEDTDYRFRTLGRVAQFFLTRGDVREALRCCTAISSPLDRSGALFEVGQTLVKEKQLSAAMNVFDQTVEVAKAIEPPYDSASLLLQIADQVERLGYEDKARAILYRAVDLARSIPQDHEASKTLRGCARILAGWNRLSEAITVAELIDRRWFALRESTLEEIRGGGEWPVQPRSE